MFFKAIIIRVTKQRRRHVNDVLDIGMSFEYRIEGTRSGKVGYRYDCNVVVEPGRVVSEEILGRGRGADGQDWYMILSDEFVDHRGADKACRASDESGRHPGCTTCRSEPV